MKRFHRLRIAAAILFGSLAMASCEIDMDDLLRQQNINGYVITTRSDNYSQGYAGLFVYMEGNQPMCRIEAIPYDGYRFKSWNKSIYENPHTFKIEKSENFVVYFERSSKN